MQVIFFCCCSKIFDLLENIKFLVDWIFSFISVITITEILEIVGRCKGHSQILGVLSSKVSDQKRYLEMKRNKIGKFEKNIFFAPNFSDFIGFVQNVFGVKPIKSLRILVNTFADALTNSINNHLKLNHIRIYNLYQYISIKYSSVSLELFRMKWNNDNNKFCWLRNSFRNI